MAHTIIAIANQKGGVTKTTTTANLGIGLVQEGKHVLLVDVDPQASLTVSLGYPQPDRLPVTLSQIMGKLLVDAPIEPKEGILRHAEGVDLMPASIELSGMEVSLVNAMSREKVLKQYLDNLKRDYDYILLDCIVETAPPMGYLKSYTSIQLTVDGSFINSTEPIATVVNCHNEITLKKMDTEGNPLAGAAFALLKIYGEQIMAAVSDADGIAHFVKIPYGQYTLSETQAPEGFSPMEDIPLTVDGSWTEPVEYTCVDIPNYYEFIKVDNRHNPLAGVKFVLEDVEGNYLRELVSGDDGIVHVTDLLPGTYTIRETETLEGFNKSDETIELVIDEHYVAPVDMYRFVNYSGIQTGFEMAMTSVMWGGLALVFAGVVLAITSIKKANRKSTRRKGRRVKKDRC